MAGCPCGGDCEVACGAKIFERHKTPITGDLIEAVASRIADRVRARAHA
jgi:hypothetical protein